MAALRSESTRRVIVIYTDGRNDPGRFTAMKGDETGVRSRIESDGVMLLSRVKWHTGFVGKLESGVHKMMAIGLGKWEGAKRYHAWALRVGMERVIRSVGKVMLDTGRMLGGLAILEDAYHSTAEVHALGADGMAKAEEKLLARVSSWKYFPWISAVKRSRAYDSTRFHTLSTEPHVVSISTHPVARSRSKS